MDSLFSFPVGLFHPLQHAGLSRRSPSAPSSRSRPQADGSMGHFQGKLPPKGPSWGCWGGGGVSGNGKRGPPPQPKEPCRAPGIPRLGPLSRAQPKVVAVATADSRRSGRSPDFERLPSGSERKNQVTAVSGAACLRTRDQARFVVFGWKRLNSNIQRNIPSASCLGGGGVKLKFLFFWEGAELGPVRFPLGALVDGPWGRALRGLPCV